MFGIERFKIATIRNIAVKLLTITAIFIFVKSENDINLYAIIISSGTLVGLAIILPSVFKEVKFVKPSFKGIMAHIKGDLILFLPLLAVGVYQYIDKIMLGLIQSNVEVGYYSYAMNIIGLPISLITGVCTVVMPRISFLRKNDENNGLRIIKASVFYVFILGVAMTSGLYAVANVFVPVFLGDQYSETTHALQLLCFSLPIQCLTLSIRMVYLIPYEKDKIYVISIFVGALANIIGNAILIPNFGIVGACYATVAANAMALIVQTCLTLKNLPYLKWLKNGIPFIALGVLMAVGLLFFSRLFKNHYLSLSLQVLTGTAFYLSISAVILRIEKEEYFISFIGKLLRKR